MTSPSSAGWAPPSDALRRYAELVVKAGVDVQRDQPVGITALSTEHAPLVRAIAVEAYRVGARSVEVAYADPYIDRTRIERGRDRDLSWSPPGVAAMVDALEKDCGALIAVLGTPELELFGDVAPDRILRAKPAPHFGRTTFTAIAYPTEGWARSVFGTADVSRLWEAIAHSVWLNEPDPVIACRMHVEKLKRRAQTLNGYRFDAIRFTGPGTDLTVGLGPDSVWGPVIWEAPWGGTSLHSLPIEEVIATPDYRRTEGVVRATRPVQLPFTRGAAIVRDLELRFEAGRAVEANASSGLAMLEADLAQDGQAPFLGEIALIDGASRVAQTGLTFIDTIYDESATSHLAYGHHVNLPGRIEGFEAMTDNEELARGLNVSKTHTDFMVGGPDVGVHGLYPSGIAIALITEDRWQI